MRAYSTVSQRFYLISQSSVSYGIFPRSTLFCGRFVQFFSTSTLNDINEFVQDAHIQALSKNNNLIDLTLSSDFEVNAQDTAKADNDYAWFVRCYKRRLEATQDLVSACLQLQRCSWLHKGTGLKRNFKMTHSFIVEERMTDGNVARVVLDGSRSRCSASRRRYCEMQTGRSARGHYRSE